jgi:glycosyltransferase involved in cell wall biosynthesis/SAM-dependent methyltransferase
MPWPKISIVTPSYNQGKYIERTVRSVLLQRYPNLEYILMDGGSTDETMSRLAPYKDRFSFLTSETDHGQADAIAKGFARSSGEIMAYLNSDDLLAPGSLHFVADYFKAYPTVDFIYSHRCTVDENDRILSYWILPPHRDSLMKRWDFIPQETCFWRRSLFEKAGNVDPDFQFAMDYDLFVRFMNLGCFRRLNRFFGAFRQHSESKTTQLLGIMGRREVLKVRQKYDIRLLPHDGYVGMLYRQWIHRATRRFVSAERRLPGAFPGVDYDYNDLWGGVLRHSDLREDQTERNGISEKKRSLFNPICPVTHRFPDRLLFSVTSKQNTRVRMSDIYLAYRSRTAIISPSLGEYRRCHKVQSLDEQPVTGAESTNGDDPGLRRDAVPEGSINAEELGRHSIKSDQSSIGGEDQTAGQIIALSRDLVSERGEVTFLEVGCQNGELLDELKLRTKWKVFGLEISPSVHSEEISRRHQVFEASLEDAPDLSKTTECFDLIYLRHGIERFKEPRVSLRSLALLLNPRGLLILSTPNLDSEQLKLLGPAWAHWKPGEHHFIYSKKSLRVILALSGFYLTELFTFTYPDAKAQSVRLYHNNGAAAPPAVENSEPQGKRRTSGVTRPSQLLRNRLGKGDMIFAICRKVF